jgi:hypothetical protein
MSIQSYKVRPGGSHCASTTTAHHLYNTSGAVMPFYARMPIQSHNVAEHHLLLPITHAAARCMHAMPRQ